MTIISKEEYLKNRTEIIDKCNGCDYVTEDIYCSAYLFPDKKWRIGNCPAATHIKKRIDGKKEKVRVGQQKQKQKKKKT